MDKAFERGAKKRFEEVIDGKNKLIGTYDKINGTQQTWGTIS
jgi:hypothetical protein